MTVREIYEAVLVEINKVNAATFTTEEFNYVINKSLLAFTNERYNFYAVNQQLSDDLRVLLKGAEFNYNKNSDGSPRNEPTYNPIRGKVYSAGPSSTQLLVSSVADLSTGDVVKFDRDSPTTYTVATVNADSYPYVVTFGTSVASIPVGSSIFVETAPVGITYDYAGIADSYGKAAFNLTASDYLHILSCRVFWKGLKPNGQGAYLVYGGKRMTFDIQNVIQNNVYMRPAFNRPYYMVHDNLMNAGIDKITDLASYKAYQNKPKIDVHIGESNSLVTLDKVVVDYIKIPEPVILNDIDIFTAGKDTSQVLEFPDYLKNEIVKRVSEYILEYMGSPRTGTHRQLNQEIPPVPYEMQKTPQPKQTQQSQE
jgi:phenylpyruvate tautomerase PptA (4-oxalocrotonate tautomerase family)